MRLLVTIIAVAVSFGMIGVSIAINYRFGYSLGIERSVFDAQLLGALSGFADAAKAVAPLLALYAFRKRFASGVVAGIAIWCVCSAYSIASSIGFSAETRDLVRTSQERLNASADEAGRELDEISAQMASLGTPKPVAAIEEQLKGMRNNRRWATTTKCTNATVEASRSFCTSYQNLRSNLGSAVAFARLSNRSTVVRAELKTLRSQGAGKAPDAQAQVFVEILGRELRQVHIGFVLLLAAVVEAVSGLGLTLALAHYGNKLQPPKEDHPAAVLSEQMITFSPTLPIGEVHEYGVERLHRDENHAATVRQIYDDYEQWCGAHGLCPIEMISFTEGFSRLAAKVQIASVQLGDELCYLQVRCGQAHATESPSRITSKIA